MLRGFLDVVTSTGYVDGWAFDTEAPTRPLTLAVRLKAEEVARGIANRFRADLVTSECGTGWCAFRFRIEGPVGRLRRSPSTLVALPSGRVIFEAKRLGLEEDRDPPPASIEDIVRRDPTVVGAIDQLIGCARVFAAMIETRGLEAFIRAAYVYVLGRPADPSGIEAYAGMLASGTLTPFGLVRALSESEEFRATPRLLAAPTEPGFVFYMQ
jgi:hypothetical protein